MVRLRDVEIALLAEKVSRTSSIYPPDGSLAAVHDYLSNKLNRLLSPKKDPVELYPQDLRNDMLREAWL